MKILVFSDSHRAPSKIADSIKANMDAEAIIYLGDGEEDFEKALERNGIFPYGDIVKDVYSVYGNCDLLSDKPGVVTAEIGGVRFLITHGFVQNVKQGLERLAVEAFSKKCSVALFGHTHEQTLTEIAGVKLFNPGAVRNKSFGVITIENGEIKFEWRETVEDDLIRKFGF